MTTQNCGTLGEDTAEKFLKKRNYGIISRNFHSRFGELDIIAFDYSKSQLVFVEVKTRWSDLFGEPQESISFQKIERIHKTALHFLNSTNKFKEHSWRIDLVAVKLNSQKKKAKITHFKNINYGT